MLGLGALGQYALGQVSEIPQVALTGVAGTGAVGSLSTLTGVAGTGAAGTIVAGVDGALVGIYGTGALGALTTSGSAAPASVYGTGAVGTLVPSVLPFTLTGVFGSGAVGAITLYIPLTIVQRLKLSNVLRRMRLLGNWSAPRARNMYVGRDFDPANPTENEVYSLDFVNELATGETILSVSSTTLTVFQGTDANPSSHLSGSSSITGTVVSQRLATLTSGVTYTLSFTVLTNLTNTVTLFSRVACRPVQ